jgi:hypothetical protein
MRALYFGVDELISATELSFSSATAGAKPSLN